MSSTGWRNQPRYEAFEKMIGPWMLALSILFIPIFLFTLVPSVPPNVRLLLEQANWTIWGVFLLEYIVRLSIAPDRGQMVRAHAFDLLVLVLPFLRGFRAIRALRGLARAAFAIGGVTLSGRALENTRRIARRQGVPYVVLLVALSALAGALIIRQIEADAPGSNIRSFGDAVWWAVSTVTTVGYGDRYPTTTEGRTLAFGLMLLGLGLFSVVTARVAAFFMGDEEADESIRLLRGIDARLRRLEQAGESPVGVRDGAAGDQMPTHGT